MHSYSKLAPARPAKRQNKCPEELTLCLCILAIAGGAPPGASAERKFLAPRVAVDEADVTAGVLAAPVNAPAQVAAPPAGCGSADDGVADHADGCAKGAGAAASGFLDVATMLGGGSGEEGRATTLKQKQISEDPPKMHADDAAGLSFVEHVRKLSSDEEWHTPHGFAISTRGLFEKIDGNSNSIIYPASWQDAKPQKLSDAPWDSPKEVLVAVQYTGPTRTTGTVINAQGQHEEVRVPKPNGAGAKTLTYYEYDPDMNYYLPLFQYEGEINCCSAAAHDPTKFYPVPDGLGKIIYARGMIKYFAGISSAEAPDGSGVPLPMPSPGRGAIKYNEKSPTGHVKLLDKYKGPVELDPTLWRPVPAAKVGYLLRGGQLLVGGSERPANAEPDETERKTKIKIDEGTGEAFAVGNEGESHLPSDSGTGLVNALGAAALQAFSSSGPLSDIAGALGQ